MPRTLPPFPRVSAVLPTVFAVVALCLPRLLPAAEAGLRDFNVPAGPAETTLSEFRNQSGAQVAFPTDLVRGVTTNPVKGRHSPETALELMTARTGLVVVRDEKSGSFAIRRVNGDGTGGAAKKAPARAEPLPAARAGTGQGSTEAAAGDAPTPPGPSRVPSAAEVRAAADEAVELSPFVVKADPGWIATATMSGTRLRTDLRDVPNEIQTFTKDFMEDLGLNTINEALIYSANAENNDEFLASNAETSAFYTNDAGRVRGLDFGTKSTNMFETNISSDNYNVDSVTLVSGPSSTLFGLGSPSGTFDTSPSQAAMRNRASTRLQYSSESSRRATLDLNRVIIPRVLALRVMALWKDEETSRKPNHDQDRRLTGAVTLQPLKHTVIRARLERTERDMNRVARTAPYDSLSLWVKADQVPGSPYRTGRPGWDNRNAAPANLSAATRIFVAQIAQPLFIANAPGARVMNWGSTVRVQNPSAATAYGVPDSDFDAGIDRTFPDESLVPFDINPFGDLKTTKLGGTTRTFFLEQKLASNLFLELAHNHENSYMHTLGARGQNLSAIYADPNLYLPALLPGQTTREPNPNFGRYYVEYVPSANPSVRTFDDLRATLSYELDLQRGNNHWRRWLGHHRFAGLLSRNETTRLAQPNFIARILDDPLIPGRTLNARTGNNWAVDTGRNLRIRSYLDSSFQPAGIGALDQPIQLVDGNGAPFHATGAFDSGFVAASGKHLGTSNSTVSGSKRRLETQLLTWQGRFLPDRQGYHRLVLTYGYREDKTRSALPDADSRRLDAGAGRTGFYPIFSDVTWDEYGPGETGLTRNTGAVLRPLRWLGVFYNRSSTFDTSTGVFDAFGGRYPGAHGEGRDYGVRLDLGQGRFSLRLNKYENVLGPSRTANNINNYRGIFTQIEGRVRTLDPALGAPDNWFNAALNYGYANYQISSDRSSTGYELAIDFRPVPNWNIRLNGAKSTAVETNIGADWIEWVKTRQPVWQSVVAKNGEIDAAGRPVTWATADMDPTSDTENRTLQQFYDQQVVGTALAFMQAADGRDTDGARGKRANLVTNYRLTEGRLRGCAIGGAVRWRPPPTIGYPTRINQFGTKVLDVSRPYRGKQELPVDANLGYRGRLRHFGGIGYNVQLNIRNVLDESRPIPVTAFSNGEIARLATVEPRLFILTCGFEF